MQNPFSKRFTDPIPSDFLCRPRSAKVPVAPMKMLAEVLIFSRRRSENDNHAKTHLIFTFSHFQKEAFTDSDNFRIDFLGNPLPADARRLLRAAAVFVDLQYFEKKAR